MFKSIIFSVLSFLKSQIQELGVIGFLFASLFFVLCFPFFLLGFLGLLISHFNDWTKSWFSN